MCAAPRLPVAPSPKVPACRLIFAVLRADRSPLHLCAQQGGGGAMLQCLRVWTFECGYLNKAKADDKLRYSNDIFGGALGQ